MKVMEEVAGVEPAETFHRVWMFPAVGPSCFPAPHLTHGFFSFLYFIYLILPSLLQGNFILGVNDDSIHLLRSSVSAVTFLQVYNCQSSLAHPRQHRSLHPNYNYNLQDNSLPDHGYFQHTVTASPVEYQCDNGKRSTISVDIAMSLLAPRRSEVHFAVDVRADRILRPNTQRQSIKSTRAKTSPLRDRFRCILPYERMDLLDGRNEFTISFTILQNQTPNVLSHAEIRSLQHHPLALHSTRKRNAARALFHNGRSELDRSIRSGSTFPRPTMCC
ncbi:hypothetical protein EX30DRAFT_249283 [Ascodesmis nigricans]|uniref:Uncharacterized protein n=1 Tax=Ascodesmis nigricans TaxID=341454 RepID=A0A4S2MY29_9PEZI|nr:hypothetical protein EX30DRAFT_249283 [Ascodesmis nigricans]